MVLIIIVLIGAALILAYSSVTRSAAKERHLAFLSRVEAAEAWINSLETLPIVEEPGVALQKGEVCYWSGACAWFELRSRTTRVSYHGPALSIPIVKGVRYRIGSISPTFERTTELTPIDSGILYITSKRFFFDGAEKNSTVPYKNVTKIALFDGGFEVEKQTGRSPHLKVSPDSERVAALALRAHADWHEE